MVVLGMVNRRRRALQNKLNLNWPFCKNHKSFWKCSTRGIFLFRKLAIDYKSFVFNGSGGRNKDKSKRPELACSIEKIKIFSCLCNPVIFWSWIYKDLETIKWISEFWKGATKVSQYRFDLSPMV